MSAALPVLAMVAARAMVAEAILAGWAVGVEQVVRVVDLMVDNLADLVEATAVRVVTVEGDGTVLLVHLPTRRRSGMQCTLL